MTHRVVRIIAHRVMRTVMDVAHAPPMSITKSPMSAHSPTEIGLMAPGDVALFWGRLATLKAVSPGGTLTVEVVDAGGRARLFKVPHTSAQFEPLATGEYELLDTIVKTTAERTGQAARASRKAEIWFAAPQVGDIFYRQWRYGYLRIDSIVNGVIRAELRTYIGRPPEPVRKFINFSSLEEFQMWSQIPGRPGYDMIPYSSLRSDEEEEVGIPPFVGEWE